MPQYQNTPAGFIILRKRILSKSVPLIIGASLFGLAIFYFTENSQPIDPIFGVIYISFIAIIMIYAIRKSIKRQKELYDSYVLKIADGFLSRQQIGLPVIIMLFSDIIQITEDKNGDLLIKSTKDRIAISGLIENYNDVKGTLQTIIPITQLQIKNPIQKYPLAYMVLVLAVFAAVYISNNKIIVGICGIATIIIMVLSFYQIQTSKLIDTKIKRTSWFFLLVIFSIAAIIYNKVFGG